MKRTILAVDIGTSSLKAALVDVAGTISASARVRFPRTERTAQDWTDAFAEAFRALKPGADIAAITISGNGPTLVAAALDGKAGSILLWNDPVPVGSDRGPGTENKAGAGSVAGEPPGSRSIFIPRITAYRTLFPETYDHAQWLLSGPEYLIYVLTGNAVTILPEQRFAQAYWTPEDLSRSGLDGKRLPPFVLPGTVTGKTEAGIPVIAGGPDFIVALVGTNTLSPGKACDRAGTSEGLNVCTSIRIAHPEIRQLPSVISGLWNAAYLLPETGAEFHTYRKESGQMRRSYPEIMNEIEESPIFPPDGKTIHPGRAIVEKIGFSVRRGITVLEKATGISPAFCLSGGQARNDIWNQMKANITGSVFTLTATPDGELMGDAVIGFTALGEYASIQDAADHMVHIIRQYEPDPRIHGLYSEKYQHHENL